MVNQVHHYPNQGADMALHIDTPSRGRSRVLGDLEAINKAYGAARKALALAMQIIGQLPDEHDALAWELLVARVAEMTGDGPARTDVQGEAFLAASKAFALAEHVAQQAGLSARERERTWTLLLFWVAERAGHA
jgi:hypothetical protein